MWKWALLPILAIAVTTDWRSHRIYNWLTFPAFGLGLAASLAFGGWPGLLSSLEAAGIALGLGLVLYLRFHFGAGDLKLLMAIGAWLGYPAIMDAFLDMAIAGAVVSLVVILRHGALKPVLKNLQFFGMTLFMRGVQREAMQGVSALPPFPYGVSIALGTVISMAYPHLLLGRG